MKLPGLALLLLAAAAAISAQAPPERPGSYREEARVERVVVDAHVTDRRSEPMPDLTAADFLVKVDGKRVGAPPSGKTYLALHKPRGVVSTLKDTEGRPTIKTLLPRGSMRLYPIGRLDLQSTGLLLLTNDGALAAALLHPRTAVERVYAVKVDGTITPEIRARLRRGVRLEDGQAAADVRVTEALPTKTRGREHG